jgi:hypothetical protein
VRVTLTSLLRARILTLWSNVRVNAVSVRAETGTWAEVAISREALTSLRGVAPAKADRDVGLRLVCPVSLCPWPIPCHPSDS